MGITGWVILVVANIPVYFVLGWVLFDSRDEFGDALRFWLTPDIVSLFRGELGEDWWAETKLGLWASACAGCVIGESHLIAKIFG